MGEEDGFVVVVVTFGVVVVVVFGTHTPPVHTSDTQFPGAEQAFPSGVLHTLVDATHVRYPQHPMVAHDLFNELHEGGGGDWVVQPPQS